MSDTRVAITTQDNPYSPFTQFDQWYQYDESHGYHTCAYLARVAITSIGFSDDLNNDQVEQAIDDIIRLNGNSFYKKLVNDGNNE